MENKSIQDVLVSIIIPIYNVEEYIEKSIESMQAQTHKNWELFAVIDGSPDKSIDICNRMASLDSRIKVIEKKNGGAHTARNVAIDLANGKYFYFMDGDDWAEVTLLEDMVTLAEENQSELVVTGFYIDTYYNDEECYTANKSVDDKIYASQEEFRKDAYRLFDNNLLYTPWNKLYLGSYIRDKKLYFPITFWDDFPFNISVLRDVERVVVSSQKYYHFIRKREESETAKYRADMYEKRETEHQWMKDLYKHWNISDEKSMEFVARRYVDRIIGCVENVVSADSNLSKADQNVAIKNMITTDEFRKMIVLAKPQSLYSKVIYSTYKFKLSSLSRMQGKFINKVKTGNVRTFARLKENR